MPNKKIFILGIILLLSIFGFLFLQSSLVSSQEVSFCCEKTKDTDPIGDNSVFCQNAPQDQCDDAYRSVPTSCEATSYCKKGTCVNRGEGICIESPRIRCEGQEGVGGGAWYDSPSDEVPLCKLGCCLIGDQAAFVTQTRCQKLSSFYGLNINFQANIQNEIECIAMATPEAKGACVLETQTGRTCKFVTKKECKEIPGDFHQGILCSNSDLGADCGATKRTTCVEGRDEVYFVDSCGNLANVYDSRKVNDTPYWSYIAGTRAGVEVDCGDKAGNKGSATCGACNYYLGSTCKSYDRNIDGAKSGLIGNNICRDLGCKYENREYEHGETWCGRIEGSSLKLGENPGVTNEEINDFDKLGNLPGSRDFRFVCYNGEVTIEPCADFRQEVCLQSEVGGFKTASCMVNLWRDCYVQDNKDDCENIEKRDCKWIIGRSILTGENGEELVYDEDEGKLVPKGEDDDREGASCVPLYSPGFDFWKEGDAGDVCSIASITCVVKFKKGLLSGEWKVIGDETCLENFEKKEESKLISSWVKERINLCSALGDCGISKNYINVEGYYKEKNLITITEGNFEEGEE